MSVIKVKKPGKYDITVEKGIISRCGEIIKNAVRGNKCLIVTDTNVEPLYMNTVANSLKVNGFRVYSYVFEAGGENKNIRTVEDIIAAMCGAELTRNDFAVALGGGVCSDLVGFAASVYKRGIDFVTIPTTLLAQIDASVGGKTGCDTVYGKNVIGTFHAPAAVVTDPDCLATLPHRYFCDGLAEAIKYGVIASASLFERLSTENADEFTEQLITECITIKRDITERDFYEKGDRILLNLGHTLGHAIEKYYNYKDVTHGEAIGIGMVAVTLAAERHGECEKGTAAKITECLHNCELPATTGIGLEKLCGNVTHDKKRYGDDIKLVIPKKIGSCTVKLIPINKLYGYFGDGYED